MENAKAEGIIPANRKSLTGDETAILARFATQDGFINQGISVFYEADAGLVWLDLLYVEPEYRRQNIGWHLIEETRAFAVQQRFREIALGTMASNAPMRALMAKAPGLFREELRDHDGPVHFSERLARSAAR
ncbi:GNAT family N-acetyltransferase [Rhizobium skierniewicense]|uniref:GNAT family N-acetyltransferase n=1 Tax=Rhizobium skierniewicense TaxID=984260 RepID=UPI001571F740|nr:GNAT family N-acetyltransferase [Rhizobium skierniewicense]NTF32327.1 GNAT family N-acetyltransferase [Rhizobium skierniewicense]